MIKKPSISADEFETICNSVRSKLPYSLPERTILSLQATEVVKSEGQIRPQQRFISNIPQNSNVQVQGTTISSSKEKYQTTEISNVDDSVSGFDFFLFFFNT